MSRFREMSPEQYVRLAEHISDLMIWTGCSDAFVAELHDLIDGEAEALRDEIEGIRDAIAEDKS